MILDFIINGQSMSRNGTSAPIVGSLDFVKARFKFNSDDWVGMTKYVLFSRDNNTYEILLDDTLICDVPYECISKEGSFLVQAVGHNGTTSISTSKSEVIPVDDTLVNEIISRSENRLTTTYITKALGDITALVTRAEAADPTGKADKDNTTLTGIPTTPTPDGETPKQITNVEYVAKLLDTLNTNLNKLMVKTVNKVKPDDNGNVAVTKAEKDNEGNEILNCYAADLFASGNTLLLRSKSGKTLSSINLAEQVGTIPTGAIFAYGGTTAPSGTLFCDGSALSRTTYAGLFDIIGTIYGTGDGSTTFNLPNLSDNRFIEGSSAIGTYKSAGLPNIYGEFGADDRTVNHMSGCCTYHNGTGGDTTADGGDGMHRYVSINASLSSSVYGNSDTVQPKSLTLRYVIKY